MYPTMPQKCQKWRHTRESPSNFARERGVPQKSRLSETNTKRCRSFRRQKPGTCAREYPAMRGPGGSLINFLVKFEKSKSLSCFFFPFSKFSLHLSQNLFLFSGGVFFTFLYRFVLLLVLFNFSTNSIENGKSETRKETLFFANKIKVDDHKKNK